MEQAGVECDGVGQIGARHQLRDERMPRRQLEGLHHAEQQRQRQDVPRLHPATEREHGQRQRLQHGQRLRAQQQVATREAVGQHPAVQPQHQARQHQRRARQAEYQAGLREPVQQPGLRQALHPGAGQRHQLTEIEQAEVAMPEGTQGVAHARSMREAHCPRKPRAGRRTISLAPDDATRSPPITPSCQRKPAS
jgi:hypothetical protein